MKLVMETLWQLLIRKKNRELKESIRIMNSQSDVEKINLTEEGKKKALMKLLSTMKLLITV